MTPEELTQIRLRDAKAETRHAARDRRALLGELDRVRDLWEDCRTHCFDPSEVKPPFRRMDPLPGDRHPSESSG